MTFKTICLQLERIGMYVSNGIGPNLLYYKDWRSSYCNKEKKKTSRMQLGKFTSTVEIINKKKDQNRDVTILNHFISQFKLPGLHCSCPCSSLIYQLGHSHRLQHLHEMQTVSRALLSVLRTVVKALYSLSRPHLN